MLHQRCMLIGTGNYYIKTILTYARNFSTVPKRQYKGEVLISCRQKSLNHYNSMFYDKLDEVPLASKGWNHHKSRGDNFTVHAALNTLIEETYNFRELGLHVNLIEALRNEGIQSATEFQYRAITTIQSGRHALLAAETGCGKTLSYLLPIVQQLIGDKAKKLNTPKAIVILPNRELAHQVGEIAHTLGTSVGVNVKVIVGGGTKKIMMNPAFEEIDLLVGTPGVLGKLSTVGIYKLNEVQCAVLDEADTLLDDSFIEKMNNLIKRVSQSQIILVSATLHKQLPDILSFVEPTLKHVVSQKIHRPSLNITQRFLRLTKSTKSSHLLQIAKSNNDPMLIFTNKSKTCDWVALFLRENDVPCSNLNGDMNYAIRVDQWNQFVKGETKILSATDVGSRGLNTIQVKHVVNYDFPLYAADYLHRIGRIGRLGSPMSCKATNFITGSEEVKLVQQIELAVRRDQPLTNVDGNITGIVQKKIARQIRESA